MKQTKKQLKALDKEIPLKQIDPKHAHLYQEAKEKEWKSWPEYKTIDVIDEQESIDILQREPERVLNSRFVYRNKNAGKMQSGVAMPVRAKARLVIGGQNCPDMMQGLI